MRKSRSILDPRPIKLGIDAASVSEEVKNKSREKKDRGRSKLPALDRVKSVDSVKSMKSWSTNSSSSQKEKRRRPRSPRSNGRACDVQEELGVRKELSNTRRRRDNSPLLSAGRVKSLKSSNHTGRRERPDKSDGRRDDTSIEEDHKRRQEAAAQIQKVGRGYLARQSKGYDEQSK